MFNVIKKIKNSLTRVLKWQIKESDHSRLETPLRPHSESSAGGHGWGWGPERVGDRHILTHTSIFSNNIKHTFIVTVGIRMSTRTLRRRSSIPRTSVIMER